MKYLSFFAGALLLTAALSSCNKRNRSKVSEPCAEDIACTEEFRQIGVVLRDAAGAPLVLDSFKTIRNSDGRVLARSSGVAGSRSLAGHYPVADDGMRRQTEPTGLAFTFIGSAGGRIVVMQPYIIGHDCCHIQLIEGPESITVSE